MLGKGFALSLELLDLVAAFFNGLLQLTLLALIGFDLLGLHLLGQLDFCKLEQFTAEEAILATDH
jgi:hypothetical protein